MKKKLDEWFPNFKKIHSTSRDINEKFGALSYMISFPEIKIDNEGQF